MIIRYSSMAGKGFYKDIIEGDTYKYYADGEWKVSSSGKSVPITNPFTLQVQFKVQCKCYCFPPTSILSQFRTVPIWNCYFWEKCLCCFKVDQFLDGRMVFCEYLCNIVLLSIVISSGREYALLPKFLRMNHKFKHGNHLIQGIAYGQGDSSLYSWMMYRIPFLEN